MKLFILLLSIFIYTSVSVCKNTYRQEIITSAQQMSRPKLNGYGTHYGVKVSTDQGNSYLLHSTPRSGIVATDSPMSSNWRTDSIIDVNGYKTIGSALKSSGYGNKFKNYASGGTCKGACKNIRNHLNE